MKKLFVILTAVAVTGLTTMNTSLAQKPFTEGKIVYTISYPDMEMDNQMAAMMPTEQVVFVKGMMTRTDFSMGMGINSSSIMNGKTGDMIALTDMMGTKSAVKLSADEIKKASEKSKSGTPKVTLTSETKVIAGYTCKKAVVTNGSGGTLDIYYTDKINSKLAGMSDYKEIKGFPMEYAVEQSGIKMKFSAKSVTPEKVSDDKFSIPSDYKVMTQEEMRKQFGQ
jgi:GLPGLI family protein